MSANGKVLELAEPQAIGGAAIASCLVSVVRAKDGAALLVADSEGRRREVVGHLSQVTAVTESDRVLVLDSDEGLIVVGRLRRGGERPAALIADAGDNIEIAGGHELRLRCGDSHIVLSHDGRLELEGREVHSLAHGSMTLQGIVIELN